MTFGQIVEPYITTGNKTLTLFQLFEKRGLEGFFHPKGTSFYSSEDFTKTTKLAAISWCINSIDILYKVYDTAYLKQVLTSLRDKLLYKSFLDEAVVHKNLWSVEYTLKADMAISGDNRLKYVAAYHFIKACQSLFAPHQSNMLLSVHEQLMLAVKALVMLEHKDDKQIESLIRVAKLKEFTKHEELLLEVLKTPITGNLVMNELIPYQGQGVAANG